MFQQILVGNDFLIDGIRGIHVSKSTKTADKKTYVILLCHSFLIRETVLHTFRLEQDFW